MKKLFLLLVLVLSCECGNLTQQEVQTGVDVAQTVLNVVAGLLKKVETSRAWCDRFTVENIEVRAEVRFQCAEINDAVEYMLAQKAEYLAAVENGNNGEIDNAEAELWRAASELEVVLTKSGLAEVSP